MRATPPEHMKQSFMTALEQSIYLTKLNFDRDRIYLHAVAPVNFDSELAKLYYKNPNNLRDRERVLFCRFLRGLDEGEFTTYFRSSISVGITNTERSGYDSSVRLGDYSGPDSPFRPLNNPHHERASCLGTYKGEIFKAKINDNWPVVVDLITQAVGNLNIPDAGITDYFCRTYFRSPDATATIYIIPTGTETVISFRDYLKTKGEL
jgi:hypothetical protein